jgi:transcriptional regulator with XRE-family HTH domain
MTPFASNIRYLLWKTSPELPKLGYPALVDYVAQACGIEAERFRRLALGYEPPSGREVSAIRSQFEHLGYDLTMLETDDLFSEARKRERHELVDRSLAFMLGQIEHGRRMELAKSLGVDVSTLFRWKQGTHRPPAAKLTEICRAFGIADPENLVSDFLFLELEPISVRAKKEACKARIDAMDDGSFLDLYAGLMKLLR